MIKIRVSNPVISSLSYSTAKFWYYPDFVPLRCFMWLHQTEFMPRIAILQSCLMAEVITYLVIPDGRTMLISVDGLFYRSEFGQLELSHCSIFEIIKLARSGWLDLFPRKLNRNVLKMGNIWRRVRGASYIPLLFHNYW